MQVLVTKNAFDADFWINLLLTLLAWLPGCLHAMYVVAKESDGERATEYTTLPPTYPDKSYNKYGSGAV